MLESCCCLARAYPSLVPQFRRPLPVTLVRSRAAFFPQLAVFPVLYLDSDLAVFKFTPLDSAIACHRVA